MALTGPLGHRVTYRGLSQRKNRKVFFLVAMFFGRHVHGLSLLDWLRTWRIFQKKPLHRHRRCRHLREASVCTYSVSRWKNLELLGLSQ